MLMTLPMYDFPEVRAATDAWAAAIARQAGVSVGLSRPEDYVGAWRRDDLVFSQTCGYPFTHDFRGKLTLVGTPHFAAPGCDAFRYSSFVFAKGKATRAACRDGIAAVNTPDSMSGMLALKIFFVDDAVDGRFFGKVVQSGGHLKSLAMLQKGEADVCAIDAVCAEYARRHQPQLLSGLVELGRSPLVPGLPYVTRDANVARWLDAVAACCADPALADVRSQLMIGGFTTTKATDYDAILELEREVERKGGLALL